MYEFHGWIKLGVAGDNIESSNLEQQCVDLQRQIESFRWKSAHTEIFVLNGCYQLSIHAVPNRRRNEALELRDLLKTIATSFESAYGIVYEYDEQAVVPAGKGVFSVNVMKRGQVTTMLDPFLSPFMPIVEDED